MPAKPLVDGLVERLAASKNIRALLRSEKLSTNQLLARLRTPRGIRQMARWRRLARLHTKILAHKNSPKAIAQLLKITTSRNRSIALKANLALLELAGLKPPPQAPRPRKPKPAKPPLKPYTPEQYARLQKAASIGLDVLDGRRTLVPLEHESPGNNKRLPAKSEPRSGNATKGMRQ